MVFNLTSHLELEFECFFSSILFHPFPGVTVAASWRFAQFLSVDNIHVRIPLPLIGQ